MACGWMKMNFKDVMMKWRGRFMHSKEDSGPQTWKFSSFRQTENQPQRFPNLKLNKIRKKVENLLTMGSNDSY